MRMDGLCVQGLDALDAGMPVVEAVSRAVKELEVIGIDAKCMRAPLNLSVHSLLQMWTTYCSKCHCSVQYFGVHYDK